MTHIQNISHILEYGITHKDSPNCNLNYQPIGDGSLIQTRNNFKIPTKGKLLGEYIPFYFGFRTPMLYVIQNGFNGVKLTPPAEIIYCVTTVQQLINSKIDFVYCDGHATDTFTTFFDQESISTIENQLDFDAINAKFWKDDHDLDLKRRKEAELLLQQDLPTEYVVGFIVYNDEAKESLIKLGIKPELVHVDAKRYF